MILKHYYINISNELNMAIAMMKLDEAGFQDIHARFLWWFVSFIVRVRTPTHICFYLKKRDSVPKYNT